MLGAGDHRAAKLARLVDKDHATVAAHILEHVDLAFSVPNHQQRSAEEIQGLDHARARDVLAETDGCPAVVEQPLTLMGEHSVVDITSVREPFRRFDGGHYVAKVDHGEYLIPQLCLFGISHRKSVVATRLVHPACERECG